MERLFARILASKRFAFAWLSLMLGSLFIQEPCHGQQWAHKLFAETHHDFGTIGRNSKAEFAFVLENTLGEDLRIVSVRSSCGCTKPIVSKNSLRPNERGEILAQFNTRSFIGYKTAMITVVIDRPHYAEVQLTVSGNIRSDIVTEPGEVRFGDIDFGQSREIPIRISYAGRPDWKITDVRGTSDHLEVRMDPPVRQSNNVIFTLRVRLKPDAPIGDLHDELVVVTNDSKSDQFVMPVSGRIVAPLSIAPQLVSLGRMESGTTVKQRFIVRSTKPFKIDRIECEDARFVFTIPEEEKPVHIVPFEFRGDQTVGEIRQRVVVRTTLGEALVAECMIAGQIY